MAPHRSLELARNPEWSLLCERSGGCKCGGQCRRANKLMTPKATLEEKFKSRSEGS
jgi:hypothetical protein